MKITFDSCLNDQFRFKKSSKGCKGSKSILRFIIIIIVRVLTPVATSITLLRRSGARRDDNATGSANPRVHTDRRVRVFERLVSRRAGPMSKAIISLSKPSITRGP